MTDMAVTEFDFSFTYREKKVKASCQKFQVHNYPQLRVAVPKGKGNVDIFIFYEINDPMRKFFWFPLPGMREPYAKAIARGLKKLK